MPLPSWDLKTKEPLTSDPEKYAIETELIYKYSPFKSEQQLMEQFNKIESSSGKQMNVCEENSCVGNDLSCVYINTLHSLYTI